MVDEIRQLLSEYRGGELSRHEFIKRGLALGMTISALGLLLHNTTPAGAAPAQIAAKAKRGGTLKVTIQGPGTALDPAIISDTAAIGITHNIYNFLVRTDAALVPYPDLAKSWKVSADGLTWTFPLHTGVKFHSGKAFTADDVLYTLQRIRDPKTGSAAASLFSAVTSVEKTDDFTVVFHLKTPYPDLPVALADYHMCILERGFSGNFSQNPSGTGPWKLQEFVPADHATLVRNPNYFEAGLPYLDSIRFVFLPDASTQVAALKSGSVDFILELNPNQAQPLIGASGIKMTTLAGTGFFNLRMRSDRKPFSDPRVRQAMKLVVDRKAIAQVVFGKNAILGNDQPIAPAYGQWYSDIGLKARDVTKAKSLLAAAGYPKGLTVNLVNSPFVGGNDFAIAYQQLAADANIDVKILTESGTDYFAKDWLEVDFGLTSWGARPAPNILLSLLYRSNGIWNEGHYYNKKLDALIDAAGSESNPAKRKSLYRQIELILSNDGPSIIPFYSTFVFPLRTRVQGFSPSSDTFHYYKTAWLSS